METKKLNEETLLKILEQRFEANLHRHRGVEWHLVLKRIQANPKKLKSLLAMEATDGEPDVVAYDAQTHTITFMDCSLQSPKGRRSVCYDQAAWDSRKEFKPKAGSAESLAKGMGVTLMDETQYLYLQSLQDCDTTTSSWILTPKDIRSKGGALFGDKRFGRAFIFHNGAESYYADRGFRTVLIV